MRNRAANDPRMPSDGGKRWWRRIFTRRRLIAYVSLYFVLLTIGCAINLTDRLVMIPSTQPVKLNDIERVRLEVSETRTVDLWRRRSAATTRPEAYALEFIGNGDRAEWIAGLAPTKFPGRGVEAYAMNYPGYGQSTGPARLKTSAEAGLVAYDWLRARAGDRPIFVTGHSLGTTVALHVAANRPDVAGLVLTNPPPLRQLIRGHFGWWNLWLLAVPVSWGVPGELDSLANAQRVRAPAVFFSSGRDELVPPKYQRMVIDAYAGERRVVVQQSAGHNDGASGPDAERLAEELRWLWQRTVAHNSTRPLD